MKRVFTGILSLGLLLSTTSNATEQVQILRGRGIDGQPCAVKIVRDGKFLKSVSLEGSAKIFEILSEKEGSVGPKTEIRPQGASEILSVIEDGNQDLYRYFTHSDNFFSNGEVFKLDTNDIPKNAEEEIKGLKMVIQLGLNYDGDELVSVKAQNKAKAFLIATLASAQFTCDK